MEVLYLIKDIAYLIVTVFTALMLFVKPIREKVFNIKKESNSGKDGVKCLLRSEILKIYYKGRDNKELEQYEAENFMRLYEAYKNLGGNSFVDEIHEHIVTWKIKR